ncbi:hypothetical protein SteCoe_3343 [Stentor coeruleus]|uniref:Peptidase C51 domain-containing protein n=1 Tax=Stentor coeruleus TaxID=5963 RepID=A0A1R2CXA9_9CILI|nr:hypothetical protein SteCoe_3343 [Stentor coeruleus]
MFVLSLYMLQSLVSSNENPFGTLLGSNNNVPSYSNGQLSYESEESNYIDNIYSGVKWQSLEYVRRWLIVSKSYTFADLKCASDIWHLSHISSTTDENQSIPLYRIPNGGPCPPSPGDIIVYKRSENSPTGHVGIINKVNSDSIEISEQNWDNNYWEGDHSREFILANLRGRNFLLDMEKPIIGWMTYQENVDEKCIDNKCATCSQFDSDLNADCLFL